MKKIIITIIILGFLTILSGCNLTTLHPIFTEKDIISDMRLLGSWKLSKKPKDSSIVEISKMPLSEVSKLPIPLQKIAGKGYLITGADGHQNIITRHLVFLVKIGKYQYLDYYPLETEEETKYFDFFKVHYLRMHSFYRIDFKNDLNFEIKQFDEGFIHRMVDNKQILISHEWQPYLTTRYIITASTKELQDYLIKYADNPGAYTLESSYNYVKFH